MARTEYTLSLFDKSPVAEGSTGAETLAASVAFAQEAEALGYHSIWYAEHHGAPPLAGSAPEVLAAYVLASTRRIRVGSGGVLLQHYSPYKVAEQFRVLSALAPGRIDLGIGKAPGGLPFSTRALQVGVTAGAAQSFEQKLADLTAFLGDGPAEGHPLHGVRAYPEIAQRPDLYRRGFPPVVNHPRETELACATAEETFGPAALTPDFAPRMASEDFAFFLAERPGALLILGNGPGAPLHSAACGIRSAMVGLSLRSVAGSG